MSGDFKGNNNHQYLIGTKPETIRADMRIFKEEVLVDFKELSKKLEQKCIIIDKELKENIQKCNNKLSDLNYKLLDLSSRFILDENAREKLSELIIFKEKYENERKSNELKTKLHEDETTNKINKIEDILRNSLVFPGLIGPQCKYQKIPDFISFVSEQIDTLNDFKEKHLRDFEVYKMKIESLFNSINIKIEVIQRELNINFSQKIHRCEDNLLRELSLRDEKIKDIGSQKYDYIYKLDDDLKNLTEEMNIVKNMNEDLNNKIKTTEKKVDKNIINNVEKYKNIEKNLFIIKNRLQDSLIFLNKQGAGLKLIKGNKNISSNLNKSFDKDYKANEKKIELGKNTEPDNNTKNDIFIDKGERDIKVNTEDNNIKEKLRKRIKSAYLKESDISRYVKGEITADEIGISTNPRKKNLLIFLRKQFDEQLIDKNDLKIKSLSNDKYNVHAKDYNLNRKDEINKESINEESYLNNKHVLENRKELKTEKRTMKTINSYKNLKQLYFRDIDAKFHSFNFLPNFGKISRNNNNNFINNLKNETNIITNKKIINGIEFTKITKPKIDMEFKNKFILKNLNITPNDYKIFSLKNIDKKIPSKHIGDITKTNIKTNRVLSPIIHNIKQDKIIDYKKKLLEKENNNHKHSNLDLVKIKKKMLNLNNDNNTRYNFSFNSNFNYEWIDNFK